MKVFIGNTNLLEVLRLTSVVENEPIADAVVTATIVDEEGTAVAGQTWPVTLLPTGESPSKGDYRAVLSHLIAFEPNKPYWVKIDANAGANRRGHWEVKIVPVVRTG